MRDLTPRQIVTELDRHIVGQDAAKRAVAVAIRNRWAPTAQGGARKCRKHQDDWPYRRGQDRDRPATGQAHRAPFIKVEATKYTEVGYYGATWRA